MYLSHDQINQLQNLGINISQSPQIPSKKIKKSSLFPLLSLSGFTLISFGSLILIKNKSSVSPNTPPPQNTPDHISPSPQPTQVPKSIQHYLLASQQHFSAALQAQNSSSQQQIINSLNQSILTATQAIQKYPQDYRGYLQRGRIYQSISQSQPQFLQAAINDLTIALKLQPNSSQITRLLASLYAQKGDADSTLSYLQQTILLEPTQAQNFYDLARLQQQIGQLNQALNTYNQLLPLLSDSTQIKQVQTEKQSLEDLLSQRHTHQPSPAADTPHPAEHQGTPQPTPTLTLPESPPLLQALSDSSLIIAAPQNPESQIQVSQLTSANSLSGTATLPAGQKQITLQNSRLTPSSQVYLTTIKGGKNQSLQLISKTQNSFTVGLSSPLDEEIKFKWWIIN